MYHYLELFIVLAKIVLTGKEQINLEGGADLVARSVHMPQLTLLHSTHSSVGY